MKRWLNQLWIRMAFTFAVVQTAFILLPFGVFLILSHYDILPEHNAPQEQVEAIFEGVELSPEHESLVLKRVQREMRSGLPRELIQLVVLSGVVGSIAGFLVSRRLTRPLNALEAGAKQIGLRQLDYRIDTTVGSAEIQAVAQAFNGMAEQLEDGERVRKNLLADVAHELRTPLTVIQGNLRAMLDGVYPMNEEEVSGVFKQTIHLTQLVHDLHELAQAEADQLQLNIDQVDVAELVQSCALAFRPLANDKKVQLRPELLGKLPHIPADRTRLAQALHNLINNGIEHTPNGGAVTVQAEHIGGSLFIRVSDTGEGIESSHLPHVFDRFYRTDSSRQRHSDQTGSGLGLAIVRGIVKSHHGKIEVESAGLGKGSLFVMQLPVNTKFSG